MVAFDTPRAMSVAVLFGCILHQAWRTAVANDKLTAYAQDEAYSATVLGF